MKKESKRFVCSGHIGALTLVDVIRLRLDESETAEKEQIKYKTGLERFEDRYGVNWKYKEN